MFIPRLDRRPILCYKPTQTTDEQPRRHISQHLHRAGFLVVQLRLAI